MKQPDYTIDRELAEAMPNWRGDWSRDLVSGDLYVHTLDFIHGVWKKSGYRWSPSTYPTGMGDSLEVLSVLCKRHAKFYSLCSEITGGVWFEFGMRDPELFPAWNEQLHAAILAVCVELAAKVNEVAP